MTTTPIHELVTKWGDRPSVNRARQLADKLGALQDVLDDLTAEISDVIDSLDAYIPGTRSDKLEALDAVRSSDLAYDLAKLGRLLDGVEP